MHSYFPSSGSTGAGGLTRPSCRAWRWCDYGVRFAAAVETGRIYATQFHPEKSQKPGIRLLENFAAIVKESAVIVIPAVDLREGRCVRLREGRADAETVFSDDPVAMAERWVAAGAERLHVVDLDGAFAGAPRQTALIAKIVDAVRPVPVEAGGGLRDLAAVETVLEAGVAWAVVGTRAAVDPAFLAEVCRRFRRADHRRGRRPRRSRGHPRLDRGR